jgi:8-oxo-dGTP pyrophosphatase MutT (NUDIX family)
MITRAQFEAITQQAAPSDTGWNYSDLSDLLLSDNLREAAVLIGLIARESGWHVLLTKRTEQLNSHAGQIAFPGGRRDAHDHSAIATALREAEEEVGIPSSQIEVIGYLERFATISNFIVTPVLAILSANIQPQAQESEVAEIFEVPLAHFLDPQNVQHESREYQGRVRTTIVYYAAGHRIWGATASMLWRFAQGLVAK